MDDKMEDLNENAIDDAKEATIGMTEIDGFDFERAAMLMGIIEKVANVAPKASAISGCAQAALNEMNEEAKAIAKRRAEEFTKLEAAAVQKRAEEQAQRETDEAEVVDDGPGDGRPAPTSVPRPARQPARAIPSQPLDTGVGRRV